jgi:hypothetical protein
MNNWKWYNYAIIVALVFMVAGLFTHFFITGVGFVIAAAACGAGAGDGTGAGG